MVSLPTGTVTLVFTDIEGSTRLLHNLGDSYRELLEQHRALCARPSRPTTASRSTQGDAFFYSFSRAQDAVAAAVAGQGVLSAHDFGDGIRLRVRMGLHTGEPVPTQEGYVGPDVHLGARICSVAWG